MVEERYAKKPLLYIQQPLERISPVAKMQHHYTNAHETITHTQQQQKAKRRIRKRSNSYQPFEQNLHGSEEVLMEKEKDEDSSSKEKRFNDLKLEEKVNYFLNRSIHSPSLRSEIKTNDETYRGIITNFENNEVHIKPPRRASTIAIPFEEIKAIHLLGF